jgi:ABC-type multidrug transport system permease subunit
VRTIWLLLKKDLLRRRRAPLAVIALLIFPLMFAGLISLAFGGGDAPLPAARLLVEDNDKDLAARIVNGFFDSEELRRFVAAEPAGPDGRQRLANGEASALLVLPEGLTERLLAGDRVELELLRNPAESILPQIAEEISRTLTDVLAIGAELLKSQKDELGITSLESFDQLDEAGFGRFGMAAQKLGRAIGPYLDLEDPIVAILQVELDKEGKPKAEQKAADTTDGPSTRALIFLMILPGVMVYSLFSIGEQMMRDLLFESSHGTLRRQLCAPLSVVQVIAAKVLVAATVAGAALLILMGLAVGLTGRGVDPAGFAVLSLAVVLAVAGASATIYGFARTERQGAAIANMIYLLLAFVGGTFIPTGSLPAAARKIAPFSPFYWGARGFQDLLAGQSLTDILPAIGILLGLGALLLTLGSVLLDRRFTRGALA